MIPNERKLLNVLVYMKEDEIPMFMLHSQCEGVYKVFDESFLARYTVMVTADRTYEVYFEHPETEETLFVGEYTEVDNLQWLIDSNEVWEKYLPQDLKKVLLAVNESARECAERLRNGEDPEDIALDLDEGWEF